MEQRKPDPTDSLRWIRHRVERAFGIDRTEAIRFLSPWKAAKRKGPSERLKRKIQLLDFGEPFGFGIVDQFEVAVIDVHPAAAGVFKQKHAFPGRNAALIAGAGHAEHAARVVDALQRHA